MAIYDRQQLRDVLPREGTGVEDFQIDSAIASAREEVLGLVGEDKADSELVASAINNLAQADVLDIIFPRDARREGSSQLVLREAAERKLGRFLQIQTERSADNNPATADSPPAILTQLEARGTVYLPDVSY